MALARIALSVDEVDWLVGLVDAVGSLPRDKRFAVRELKRAQRAAHESRDRERAETARIKAGFRTAPGKNPEPLNYGQIER